MVTETDLCCLLA